MDQFPQNVCAWHTLPHQCLYVTHPTTPSHIHPPPRRTSHHRPPPRHLWDDFPPPPDCRNPLSVISVYVMNQWTHTLKLRSCCYVVIHAFSVCVKWFMTYGSLISIQSNLFLFLVLCGTPRAKEDTLLHRWNYETIRIFDNLQGIRFSLSTQFLKRDTCPCTDGSLRKHLVVRPIPPIPSVPPHHHHHQP